VLRFHGLAELVSQVEIVDPFCPSVPLEDGDFLLGVTDLSEAFVDSCGCLLRAVHAALLLDGAILKESAEFYLKFEIDFLI
jgi:hypothetical protein